MSLLRSRTCASLPPATCPETRALLLAMAGLLSLLAAGGCRSPSSSGPPFAPTVIPNSAEPASASLPGDSVTVAGGVEHAGVPQQVRRSDGSSLWEDDDSRVPTAAVSVTADLDVLLATAESSNAQLRRLQQEAAAAWAKARYVDKLPDPTIGANVWGQPLMMADGPMRADLSFMQMIPWLKRLDARSRRATFEAMAAQQVYQAERLNVSAEIRSAWARLYVLGKQMETTQANQHLLETLIEVATARLAAGQATQGDVLLGTVELARLDEQLLNLQQQVVSATAELNRLAGRPAGHPVPIPEHLNVSPPAWDHEMLLATARQSQPEIAAAHLRTAASRWGVEVARLEQRPDVTVNAMLYFMEERQGFPMPMDSGIPWSMGAQVSVPLWHQKYQAMRDEAVWENFASHAAAEDVLRKYDALLRDLLAQAESAHAIAVLYQETIIPQARQTLETDQRAFAEDVVEFDRVIQDFRNLLTLELAYHQSLGQLAIAVARIEQAVGAPLPDLHQ